MVVCFTCSFVCSLPLPGWDPANDANGDGYVDDAEFSARVNPAASARFRYKSRAVPLGRMWSSSSSVRSNRPAARRPRVTVTVAWAVAPCCLARSGA